MKYTLITICLALYLYMGQDVAFAQDINWRNAPKTGTVNAQVGYDYGFGGGLGYGRILNTKPPTLLNITYSVPVGKSPFDDFKLKIGIHMEVMRAGNFSTTLKGFVLYRSTRNNYSRLANFGTEFSVVSGLFLPKFSLAGEFGFDKPILSQVQPQSMALMVDDKLKPALFWARGGNFHYGLVTGYSMNKIDLNLRVGMVSTADFKSTPLIPIYLQFGLNRKF